MWLWMIDNQEEPTNLNLSRLVGECHIAAWFYDELIFYADDCCESHWVRNYNSPQPYAKGKGASLMVADFVSAHYGFLQSCDGNESTHVMFKPGKNWDGYFTNDDV